MRISAIVIQSTLIGTLIGCGGGQSRGPAAPTAREQQLQQERDAAIARADAAEKRMAEMETSVARATAEALKRLEGVEAGMAAAAAAPRPPAVPKRPEPDPAAVYAYPVGKSPSVGPSNALVTLVRLTEYACPYCERSRATMDGLLKKYGPQLRIVYKPFVVHPRVATAPALATCAAHQQGKWKAMDALVWKNIYEPRAFDKVSDDGTECWQNDTCHNLESQARALKLNMKKFRADMRSCKTDLDADMAQATAFGIHATPSFFINGRFMSGAQPQEKFEQLIDAELARAQDAVRNGTAPSDYYQTNVIAAGLPSLQP